MPRGGKREGAGRPKKDRGKQDFYPDAESYLMAVIKGETAPDAVRVGAARTMLAYQKARVRGPVKSPPPAELARKSEAAEEKELAEDFERRAAVVRLEHAREANK